MLKTVLNYLLFVVVLFLYGYVERGIGYKEGYAQGRIEEHSFGTQEMSATFIRTVVPEIIQCESGGRHERHGDSGIAYGIAQFHEATFNWMRGLAGHPELIYKSEQDQRWLLTWAIKHGYGKHWNRCYYRALNHYAKNVLPTVVSWTGAPPNTFNLAVNF